MQQAVGTQLLRLTDCPHVPLTKTTDHESRSIKFVLLKSLDLLTPRRDHHGRRRLEWVCIDLCSGRLIGLVAPSSPPLAPGTATLALLLLFTFIAYRVSETLKVKMNRAHICPWFVPVVPESQTRTFIHQPP